MIGCILTKQALLKNKGYEIKSGHYHSKRRLFVVGLPRSGTTLIQSVLNAHPGVVGFPESRFYDALTHSNASEKFGPLPFNQWSIRKFARYGRARVRTISGQPGPQALMVAERFFFAAGLGDAVPRLHRARNSISALNAVFLEVLDESTSLGWVEKTPAHLFRIPLIRKLVPDARFVHIIRRPEDTVASIWDAGQKYDGWDWVMQGDNAIARLVEFCNRGHSVSNSYKNNQQHLIVFYDLFVSDPEYWLKRITTFCDLPFSEDMLTPSVKNTAMANEIWKNDNSGKIRKSVSKFNTVFSDSQRSFIRSNLRHRT